MATTGITPDKKHGVVEIESCQRGGGLYTASYLPGSQVEFVRLSSLVLMGNHHLLPLQVCKTQCISTGNSKH